MNDKKNFFFSFCSLSYRLGWNLNKLLIFCERSMDHDEKLSTILISRNLSCNLTAASNMTCYNKNQFTSTHVNVHYYSCIYDKIKISYIFIRLPDFVPLRQNYGTDKQFKSDYHIISTCILETKCLFAHHIL